MTRKETAAAFLSEMYRYVPKDARVMACQFRGDPNSDQKGKWRAFPIRSSAQLDDGANVYFAVSAMKKNEAGEFRRRKDNFAGGILLMIDDVGTGPGSKFPLDLLKALTPTAIIETSPKNYQAVYFFDSLILDADIFDRLISGFIEKQFLGKDSGMAGINRVFRPPYGVNAKPKYGGWQVVMRRWYPENRYSIEKIAKAFDISLAEPKPERRPHGATLGKSETIKEFVRVRSALRAAGMLKKEKPDRAGWQDIFCPWTAHHTGGADNGAAIREPAEENDFIGAFRCHHGGCDGKGWRELTDWLSENEEALLEEINRNAKEFSFYARGKK